MNSDFSIRAAFFLPPIKFIQPGPAFPPSSAASGLPALSRKRASAGPLAPWTSIATRIESKSSLTRTKHSPAIVVNRYTSSTPRLSPRLSRFPGSEALPVRTSFRGNLSSPRSLFGGRVSLGSNSKGNSIPARFNSVVRIFFLRLLLPAGTFSAFCIACAFVYVRLEHISFVDALFWIIHPHAIEYREVGDATKLFAIFVFFGVFSFQIWVAERVLGTLFRRQGMEAWKSMLNDAAIENLKDHFIVCGYGQVGRTAIDQLTRMKIPFVLIETNDGLYRELLKDGMNVVQGDAKRHDVLETAGIRRARGICVVIDNDADNLYITVTARSLNPKVKIITRAGQQRYAHAIRNSGADEVVIPEYEGGLMTGRMIEKYYQTAPKGE